MADEGWAGKWELPVVDPATLDKLKDLAGAPVMGKSGRPIATVKINLFTGVLTYPPAAGM